MKKQISRLITLTLAALLFFPALPLLAHAATDITPSFADPAFLAAIRAELRKPTGPITDEDCLAITTLYADSEGIESLAGIEHLKNLSVFDCSDNELTGTLDFSANTKLTRLGCGENPITSLNLRQNPALWQLNCQDTPLACGLKSDRKGSFFSGPP